MFQMLGLLPSSNRSSGPAVFGPSPSGGQNTVVLQDSGKVSV
jgi:hypothetical protein